MTETKRVPELTAFQWRLLGLMRSFDLEWQRAVSPRQVAEMLWPDSPAWGKRTRGSQATGFGGALAGTMPMRAARELWRLQEHGLVWQDRNYSWRITSKGVQAIRDHNI